MLTPLATQSTLPSSPPHSDHLSLLQTCRTPLQLKQIHASTIKTGTFNQTPISARILTLSSDLKIGDLHYATSIFNQITHRTFSWNTIIKCYVEHHHYYNALLLFYQLLHHSSIKPNSFTLPPVIKACTKLPAIEEGKQIHGLTFKFGMASDSFVQHSLVNFYSTSDDISSAQRVFDNNEVEDSVSSNSLLEGYVRSGELHLAQKLFDKMSEKDTISWNVLIEGYSKCGEIDIARDLFDQMPNKNLVSWDTIIRCYVEHRLSEEAILLFVQLLHQASIIPDTLIFSCIIKACATLSAIEEVKQIHGLTFKIGVASDSYVQQSLTTFYSKCIDIASAQKVFNTITEDNLISSNSLLDGYVSNGEIQLAQTLFDAMPEKNIISWNILIEGYSKCGQLDIARNLFNQIPNKNLISWDTMIRCYVEHQRSEDALLLFNQLLQHTSVIPDTLILSCVIKACTTLSAIEQVKQIHGLTFKIGVASDSYVQQSLLSSYSMCFDIVSAEKVFDAITDENLVAFNSLLDGYVRCEEIQLAQRLFDRMSEKDAISWNILIEGYSKCGQIDTARKLFDQMPDKSLVTWDTITRCFAEHDRSDDVLVLFSQLLHHTSIMPSTLILSCVIKACARLSAVEEVRQIHGLTFKTGMASDPYVQQSMINFYSKCTDIVLAEKVFDTITDENLLCSNSLLDGYVRCEEIQLAQRLFDTMSEKDTISWNILIEGYSKCGQINTARELFDQMPNKDLVTWDTIIRCYVEHHYWYDVLLLFSQLLHCTSIMPDALILSCVIKACNRLSAIEEVKQIHGLTFKIGMASDSYVQQGLISFYSKCIDIISAEKVFDTITDENLLCSNSLLHGYVKCDEIQLAQRLFDIMSEKDTISWNILIEGYSKCGQINIARKFFDQMPNKNLASWDTIIRCYVEHHRSDVALLLFSELLLHTSIMPDNLILSCVIEACARLSAIEEGKQIHGFIFKIGMAFDSYVLCSLISFYSKSADTISVQKVFDTIEDENLVSSNSTLDGYVRCGEIELAQRLFDKMSDKDTFTWNLLISGYSKCGQISIARKLFDQMPNKNLVTWTAMISGYMKSGDLESAEWLFNTMPEKNIFTWNIMISGYGAHGMPDRALELFNEMRRMGMRPRSITFIHVLSACSHAGMIDEGYRCFELMKHEYGIEPLIEHYNCLVDLLCRAGKLEEALHLIEHMPIKPCTVTWTSLLSGCRIHGNIDIGEYAAKRAVEQDPEAIASSYVLLSNIYAAARQWDKVSIVREIMKEKGVSKVPGCSMIEHNDTVHKFTVHDRSHPQTEEIYLKLSEMRERLNCAGYVPDTSQVLLCIEGEEEQEAALAYHSERLAIAFGLINVKPGRPIRVVKNLRVCNDCHTVSKLLSSIYSCEIIVRDNSRFHYFKNGVCSCMDYW